MSYSIVSTNRFEKELKRLVKKYPSLKAEFAALIEALEGKPDSGINLGNNCYKVRLKISSKGKGKSGGARVISYLYMEAETVYLLTIYDKGEKESIKTNELKEMVENLEL